MSGGGHWSSDRGQGSLPLIRLIVRIALGGGQVLTYPLLHAITLYFLLFAPHRRRASRAYLARALGRAPRSAELYRHLWTFTCTLFDRIYLLAGRGDALDVSVRYTGGESLEAVMPQPCIMLGAHLGSFEVLRWIADRHGALDVRPLMYRDQAQSIDTVARDLNPALFDRVVEIGGFDSLLAAREAVDRGESVALLADRCPPGGRTVEARLLGDPVQMPAGPLLLAHMLNVPVVLCFGIRRGWRRYEVRLERFADTVRLPRGGDRHPALQQGVQAFADRVTHHCREAPFNWFNFYDYWNDFAPERDDGSTAVATPVGDARIRR